MQGISRKILKSLICAANQESVSAFSAEIVYGTCRMPPALPLQRKNNTAHQGYSHKCQEQRHDKWQASIGTFASPPTYASGNVVRQSGEGKRGLYAVEAPPSSPTVAPS
jgi:hypothetical protein